MWWSRQSCADTSIRNGLTDREFELSSTWTGRSSSTSSLPLADHRLTYRRSTQHPRRATRRRQHQTAGAGHSQPGRTVSAWPWTRSTGHPTGPRAQHCEALLNQQNPCKNQRINSAWIRRHHELACRLEIGPYMSKALPFIHLGGTARPLGAARAAYGRTDLPLTNAATQRYALVSGCGDGFCQVFTSPLQRAVGLRTIRLWRSPTSTPPGRMGLRQYEGRRTQRSRGAADWQLSATLPRRRVSDQWARGRRVVGRVRRSKAIAGFSRAIYLRVLAPLARSSTRRGRTSC